MATLTTAAATAQEPRTRDTAIEAANRTLISDAFARWGAGEFDIFSLLSDDVDWHITGYDPAVATTYRSREALLTATSFPLRARLAGPLKPNVRRIWADGDDVLVYWDGSAPLRDGSEYRNTYLWIMTVRGGRVVAVTAFLDNSVFKAALNKPAP
ncbi:nuclear transport factor 2 family protein [Sphingomonas sp. 3-13AW]|uniref:nuclear transport factor 2 family protein n=1 Tax=Sphingomonas sp. 3-13AW TaxID=3050450 RepID=UPI003BB6D0C7